MKKKILWIILIIAIIIGIFVFYKSNNNLKMNPSDEYVNIQAEIDSSINSELDLNAKISDLENKSF